MDVSVFIARHLGFGSENGRRSSSSMIIAVVGTALSMAIMILAITVVMGFKSQIREKVLGVGASITVSAPESYDEFGRYSAPMMTQNDRLRIDDALRGVYPVSLALSQSGVLKTENDFLGLQFEAFDANHDWTTIESAVVDGQMPDLNDPDERNSLILSKASAEKLGITVGEKIDAYFFTGENLRARRLNLKAVYDTHFADFDNSHCFISLPLLQRIAGIDSVSGSRIEIASVPDDSIISLSAALDNTLYDNYLAARANGDETVSRCKVDNVMKTGAAYFSWLDLLDTNVIVIIALMAAVSGFTLVSSLFILILERVKFIGILKAMGATNVQIGKVFVYMAERIIIKGMIIGNVIGLGFSIIQWKFRLLPLDASSYYLTAVPIKIDWPAILILNICVLVMSTALFLIPAHMISRISPASTMKYE